MPCALWGKAAHLIVFIFLTLKELGEVNFYTEGKKTFKKKYKTISQKEWGGKKLSSSRKSD